MIKSLSFLHSLIFSLPYPSFSLTTFHSFLIPSSPSSLLCRSTCYAHEAVGEDGELNSVELSAQGAVRVRADSHANIAPFCQTGLTARLHQDGTDGGKNRKNTYTSTMFRQGKYRLFFLVHISVSASYTIIFTVFPTVIFYMVYR